MKFNIGLAEFILEKMQLGLFQLKSICSQNQQPPWQKSFWAPQTRFAKPHLVKRLLGLSDIL